MLQQALPPEPAAARPTLPSQPRVAPATTFTRPPGPTSAASGNPNASILSASNSASTLGQPHPHNLQIGGIQFTVHAYASTVFHP